MSTLRLYQKARRGEIREFTGISSPFEAPENPAMEIRTDEINLENCVEKLWDFLEPKIQIEQRVR